MDSSDQEGRTTLTATRQRADQRAGYPPPTLTVAVLALFTLVLAICAVVMITQTTARATAEFTPIEATVVDEHTEELMVADRRGSSNELVRVVTVELPDGVLADVRSGDLAVGDTATVYLGTSGGAFESRPSPPTVLEWALCAAVVAATVVLGVVTFRAARRLRRPA
jgi:hypothetical protein